MKNCICIIENIVQYLLRLTRELYWLSCKNEYMYTMISHGTKISISVTMYVYIHTEYIFACDNFYFYTI